MALFLLIDSLSARSGEAAWRGVVARAWLAGIARGDDRMPVAATARSLR